MLRAYTPPYSPTATMYWSNCMSSALWPTAYVAPNTAHVHERLCVVAACDRRQGRWDGRGAAGPRRTTPSCTSPTCGTGAVQGSASWLCPETTPWSQQQLRSTAHSHTARCGAKMRAWISGHWLQPAPYDTHNRASTEHTAPCTTTCRRALAWKGRGAVVRGSRRDHTFTGAAPRVV